MFICWWYCKDHAIGYSIYHQTFPGTEDYDINAWNVVAFTMVEKTMEDKTSRRNNNCLVYKKVTYQKHISRHWIVNFSGKPGTNYPTLSDRTLTLPVPFATSYFCEISFSTLVKIRTKAKKNCNISNNFRQALAVTILLLFKSFNSGNTKVLTNRNSSQKCYLGCAVLFNNEPVIETLWKPLRISAPGCHYQVAVQYKVI